MSPRGLSQEPRVRMLPYREVSFQFFLHGQKIKIICVLTLLSLYLPQSESTLPFPSKPQTPIPYPLSPIPKPQTPNPKP